MKTRSLFLVFISICFLNVGFPQFRNDSIRLSGYYDLALLKPDSVTFYLEEADQLTRKHKRNSRWIETNYFLKVRYYLLSGKLDQASKLLKEVIRRKSPKHPDQAKFYNLMGSVSALQKKNDDAINWYRKTLEILDEKGDSIQSAYIKSNVANIFFSTMDYERAYPYLEEAYRATAVNDTLYGPSIEGMFAIVLLKTNQKKEAFRHAGVALKRAEKSKNFQALVIANYVLGECYLDQKKTAESEQYFKKSLELASRTGQAYYMMLSNIGLLLVCNETHQFREGIRYGDQALVIAGAMNNTNTLYSIYKNLAKASSGTGNDKQAYAYLLKAHRLYQEITSRRREDTMQELLVKYETEKKENELAKKELQLSKALNWILVLVFFITVLIVLVFWWRKRNQSRMKILTIETERLQLQAFVEGEQRERERLASEIHDGIASTLTGLMMKFQQVNSVEDISELAQQLQHIRNDVRMVSKNISPFNFKEEGWNESFRHFIHSVEHEGFAVFFIPKYEEALLNTQRGMVIYRILQELVQNTLKHAGATECELVISEDKDVLHIHYCDNGKGVSREELEKGNGWNSILKRLSAIQGKVIFPENPLSGMKIDISLPKL